MNKQLLCLLVFSLTYSYINAKDLPSIKESEAEDIVFYEDYDAHLCYSLNKSTHEATVGNEIDPEHSAILFPALGDTWWNDSNPTNYWRDIIIPEKITYKGEVYTVVKIGKNAFSRTTSVHTVTLPETITSIGLYAFSWCVNLESITIPTNVTEINAGAFTYCKSLKSVILPEKLELIGESAFSDCLQLEKINIPTNCTFIGNEAFKWCRALTQVSIDDGEKDLEVGYTYSLGIDYQGSDVPKYRGLFADCPIKTLHLGRNIVNPEVSGKAYPPFYSISNYGTNSTGGYQGQDGKTFSKVTFGNTVTQITDGLFKYSSFKNAIILSDNLETIGNEAFYHTSGGDGAFNQSELVFPASLKEIGKKAFGNCTKLRFINCNAIIPPTLPTSIAESAFYGCGVIFRVPDGTGAAYVADDIWGRYNILDSTEDILTINVKTAGTLYSRLLAQDIQTHNLHRLKLKGTLNDDDWAVLKSMTYLYDLDLSELSINRLPTDLFKQNSNLVYIKLPQNLSAIDDYAFSECTHLSCSLEIPITCTSIGKYAFYRTGIKDVIYSNSIDIDDYAFRQCYGLDSLYLKGEQTTVGEQAFWGAGIKKITIGKGVSLEKEAVSYCLSLKEIVFEDGVKMIGDEAFSSSESLEKVTYMGAIDSIGKKIYYSSRGNALSEINIYDIASWCQLPVSSIESTPLYYTSNILLNGKEPTEIIIPEGVKGICSWAFYRCEKIVSVELQDGIKTVGEAAFSGCSSLSQVKFPESLNSIGASSFYKCSSLQEIEIPLSVSSIGGSSFKDCSSLKQIVAHWDTPIDVPNTAFSGSSSDCTLYIPINTATKYFNAGWSSIPNIKETGILTIESNGEGVVSCNGIEITNQTKKVYFTPYKSFQIVFTPKNGYKICKLTLNSQNVIKEIESGALFVEEPEENLELSVEFADSSIQNGDVNGDGYVNITDAICVINHILKMNPKDYHDYWADMNDDNAVNITDVLMIINVLLKEVE
ncbi:MAG: leucine-rich repeat protein [Prevotella sp.]|nr:leucine-rich repeat protein [Prevotella sp.]